MQRLIYKELHLSGNHLFVPFAIFTSVSMTGTSSVQLYRHAVHIHISVVRLCDPRVHEELVPRPDHGIPLGNDASALSFNNDNKCLSGDVQIPDHVTVPGMAAADVQGPEIHGILVLQRFSPYDQLVPLMQDYPDEMDIVNRIIFVVVHKTFPN